MLLICAGDAQDCYGTQIIISGADVGAQDEPGSYNLILQLILTIINHSNVFFCSSLSLHVLNKSFGVRFAFALNQ